jgi:predicted NBD/HSP70 family sugar kinase
VPTSTARRTATTRDVTEINRTAILDLLRSGESLSRREIRKRTGLGSATVERLCSALIEEGVIEPAGVDRSAAGRPSTLLRHVPGQRAIVAIDVNDNTSRGRIMDLGGTVLYETSEHFDFSEGSAATARLDGTLRLIDLIVSGATGITAPLAAIGITLPGIVDDGVVVKATELDWRDLPLAQIVSDRTALPVYVENDANATVYAELLQGAARGSQSAVALVLGAGIGAGIVSDGAIYRGHGSAAGEVGYLLTSRDSFTHYFTNQGDIEAKISGAALPYSPKPPGHIDRRIGPGFRAMMRLAESGEADALRARDEFFDNLALTCAAIAVVLAPSVIVLAGAFAQYSDVSADQLAKRLAGRIPSAPRIVASSLGFDAAITGMGALALEYARDATYLS